MTPSRSSFVGFTGAPLSSRRACLAAPPVSLRPVVQRTWVPARCPTPSHQRCSPCATRVTTTSASPRTLAPSVDMGDDTTISVALPPSAVAPLGAALNSLLASFKAVAAAAAEGKRAKQPVIEFVHDEGGLRVAMECNPNLHQSAFKATVYVKVASGGVVSTQSLLALPMMRGATFYRGRFIAGLVCKVSNSASARSGCCAEAPLGCRPLDTLLPRHKCSISPSEVPDYNLPASGGAPPRLRTSCAHDTDYPGWTRHEPCVPSSRASVGLSTIPPSLVGFLLSLWSLLAVRCF